MSFIEEIVRELKISNQSFRYVIVSNEAGYFEGAKGILSFSGDSVLLQMKDCKLKIEGKNLTINKYFSGDVAIIGKIERVETV